MNKSIILITIICLIFGFGLDSVGAAPYDEKTWNTAIKAVGEASKSIIDAIGNAGRSFFNAFGKSDEIPSMNANMTMLLQ